MFTSHHLSSASSSDILQSYSARNLAPKTPVRSSNHGRVVRDENAIYGHPRNGGLTGKKKANIASFNPPVTESQFKTEKMPRVASKSGALSNKTPFRKVQFPATPVPTSLKPSKSFAVFHDTSEAPLVRRISSSRKKLRLPTSATKSFKTPEISGNHWDVSDVSIEASVTEDATTTAEDSDDVEYGPPTAPDAKFDPPFETPDYKQMGTILMSLFRRQAIPEEYDPVAEFDNKELLFELESLRWEERVELPEISVEDIFPFMAQQELLSSFTTKNRPQASYDLSKTVAPSSKPLVPLRGINPLYPKASDASHLIPSIRKLPTLANALSKASTSKPETQRTLHSLPTAVPEGRNDARPHPRAMSVRYPKGTSFSHSGFTSTTHSRSTSVSKPLSLSRKTKEDTPIRLKVLGNTVQDYFPDPGDEILGEELLFKV